LVELKVKEGDLIPDMELEGYPGPRRIKLTDYRGKWLVLYFYPKDGTHGCTKEALGFRDDMEAIRAMGADVLGVSTDGIASHRKFYHKFNLNFTLLSDPKGELGLKLGTCGNSFFKTMDRVTFILDREGRIAKTYPKVKYLGHSKQIIDDLKSLVGASGTR
jgi:peroxiredoxin Q/BCP